MTIWSQNKEMHKQDHDGLDHSHPIAKLLKQIEEAAVILFENQIAVV